MWVRLDDGSKFPVTVPEGAKEGQTLEFKIPQPHISCADALRGRVPTMFSGIGGDYGEPSCERLKQAVAAAETWHVGNQTDAVLGDFSKRSTINDRWAPHAYLPTRLSAQEQQPGRGCIAAFTSQADQTSAVTLHQPGAPVFKALGSECRDIQLPDIKGYWKQFPKGVWCDQLIATTLSNAPPETQNQTTRSSICNASLYRFGSEFTLKYGSSTSNQRVQETGQTPGGSEQPVLFEDAVYDAVVSQGLGTGSLHRRTQLLKYCDASLNKDEKPCRLTPLWAVCEVSCGACVPTPSLRTQVQAVTLYALPRVT